MLQSSSHSHRYRQFRVVPRLLGGSDQGLEHCEPHRAIAQSPFEIERQKMSAVHLFFLQLAQNHKHERSHLVQRCNPSSAIANLKRNVVASSAINHVAPKLMPTLDVKLLQRLHLDKEQRHRMTSRERLSHQRVQVIDHADTHPIFHETSTCDHVLECIHNEFPYILESLQYRQPLKQ